MKYLLSIFLIITLFANAFAASGLCNMEHEKISTQGQSMPCHESSKEESGFVEPHICDCDMSSQFIYSFVLNIFSTPAVSDSFFNEIEHQYLTINFKFRPPINFHS
mgnify:CR=1 FL=1